MLPGADETGTFWTIKRDKVEMIIKADQKVKITWKDFFFSFPIFSNNPEKDIWQQIRVYSYYDSHWD